MKRIAVVGGGISGLAVAKMLNGRFDVAVFEKEASAGGLIRCRRVEGSLFHICGGHVFNTKDVNVNDWFWSMFDKERDFVKADRKSAVCMEDGRFVDYPLENHVWQMDEGIQKSFYEDMSRMIADPPAKPVSFGDFLLKRFGRTLYDVYFRPYNAKVWRRDLSDVPLSWLDGKLPMPTPQEMIEANRNHIEEKAFVHSSFYYAKVGGSQFIVDTLAKGLDVRCGQEIVEIDCLPGGVAVKTATGSVETFDGLVFCGNVKDIPQIVKGIDFGGLPMAVERFESHGTTAVFCETDPIPYSWFYQPSPRHDSHRFICTGNFSQSNNAPGKMTCTVEFSDEIGEDEIKAQLKLMPFHPRYVARHYTRCSYPIQHVDTRRVVEALKLRLSERNVFLSGRFAEWEYFNMDAAIGSAMKLCRKLVAQ